MVGRETTQAKLNHTLVRIVDLLKQNDISLWFAGYGTLLGLVREGQCIDKDDDVDIVCCDQSYDVLVAGLQAAGLGFKVDPYRKQQQRRLIKTEVTHEFASVDFYMAAVGPEGNFRDKWEDIHWRDCYADVAERTFDVKLMDEREIHIPANPVPRLVRLYGDTWETPQNVKGGKGLKVVGSDTEWWV